MARRHWSGVLLVIADALLACAVVVVAALLVVQTLGASAPHPSKPASAPRTAADGATTATAAPVPSLTATSAPSEIEAPSNTTSSASPPPGATGYARASLDAYRGLASWVDIYDDRAWSDPGAAVADMARHGVHTLFIETANSHSTSAFNRPAQLRTFITQAHAHRMRIVAWYLPDMQDPTLDYSRVSQAIAFTAPGGQRFDSFALDIESHAIASLTARNAALTALSGRIRGLVGPSYPLGAIIPSPVGLSKKKGGWMLFPYTMLAQTYDVFLPMSYYTYHAHGPAAVYADTAANVRILRAQKGCSQTPVHLIGGIAGRTSPTEAGAFVRAVRDTGSVGASMYSWPGTSDAQWKQLGSIAR